MHSYETEINAQACNVSYMFDPEQSFCPQELERKDRDKAVALSDDWLKYGIIWQN